MLCELARFRLGEDLCPFPLRRRLATYTPILAYHSVSDQRRDGLTISPAEFERQLRYLKRCGYRSISLAQLVRQFRAEEPLLRRSIVLTFDDGYADNYHVALPLLKKYGFVATFFVVTGAVDSGELFEFDRAKLSLGLGDAAAFRPMNWDEVRKLASHGMEIGSHTVSHCELGREPDQSRLRWEVVHSKQRIETEIQREVQVLCYPRGQLTPEAIAAVRQAGYQAAVWTPALKGPWIPETSLTLKRVGLYGGRGWRNSFKFRVKLTRFFFLLREGVSYTRGSRER